MAYLGGPVVLERVDGEQVVGALSRITESGLELFLLTRAVSPARPGLRGCPPCPSAYNSSTISGTQEGT